jgi:hypothetical protein
MSSSEVMDAGISAFSFTLYSFFVGNIGQIVLKCSSLSFSATSSFNFCALIHWILLLWLCVSPRGHPRGAVAVPSAVVLDICFCLEIVEIRWSGFENRTVQFGGRCELVPASSSAKSCSSALSSPKCFPADQQKTHWVSPALAGDQVLLLLPRKPHGPIFLL